MTRNDKITNSWDEYELIDSGEFRKLERFGGVILDRPDPQAVWHKSDADRWGSAQAQFGFGAGEKWARETGTPDEWQIRVEGATLNLSFGNFKHIGIFPEHADQWAQIAAIAQKRPGVRMLNLFGYTGAASVIAALHGAQVTHVDASKQTMGTVKQNSASSGLASDAIRLVVEDALKYVKRLAQRGETFDIIIMDPPAFGRGPKGEVWKIEEKLYELASLIPLILSAEAELVVLNGYAAGFSAHSFGQLLQDILGGRAGVITYGDVLIKQVVGNRLLPTGIYASWQK